MNLNHGHDVIIMVFKHMSMRSAHVPWLFQHLSWSSFLDILWVEPGPITSMLYITYTLVVYLNTTMTLYTSIGALRHCNMITSS